MPRGQFTRRNAAAARAFLDSVYSSGGVRRGRGSRAPADLTDKYAVRIANDLRRQAEAGQPLSMAAARRGLVQVRTGAQAGQYVPAPERRRPGEAPMIGADGQPVPGSGFSRVTGGRPYSGRGSGPQAALNRARRLVPPDTAVQVRVYGKLGPGYQGKQVPQYRRAGRGAGSTWATALTLPNMDAPELANGKALRDYLARHGFDDVEAIEIVRRKTQAELDLERGT